MAGQKQIESRGLNLSKISTTIKNKNKKKGLWLQTVMKLCKKSWGGGGRGAKTPPPCSDTYDKLNKLKILHYV